MAKGGFVVKTPHGSRTNTTCPASSPTYGSPNHHYEPYEPYEHYEHYEHYEPSPAIARRLCLPNFSMFSYHISVYMR